MTNYTYTEEMVAKMKNVASHGLTEKDIQAVMDDFGFPRRSVTAKYRKMGFDVPAKEKEAPKFSASETVELSDYLSENSGVHTAEELANYFSTTWGREVTARQINGKALSLEKTGDIKPAEKKTTPKTYTSAEEAQISTMVSKGAYLEDIATALGKAPNSVRGKLLSMGLKATQRNKKETKNDPYEGLEDMLSLTVDEIVAEFAKNGLEKTARGVKTALTRRKLACVDYPKTKAAE
ncbi:MAG: hypothetical protein ACRENO_05855 [Thermodesulfobacteriota bacterium]